MTLGERVNKVKKHYDLSQDDLSLKADVTRQTISNIIKGKNIPSSEVLGQIIKAFPDINARWLATGEGAMFINAADNQINTYGKNNSIGQVNYETDQAVYNAGPNTELKDRVKTLETENKQLKNTIEHQNMIIEQYQKLLDIKKDMGK